MFDFQTNHPCSTGVNRFPLVPSDLFDRRWWQFSKLLLWLLTAQHTRFRYLILDILYFTVFLYALLSYVVVLLSTDRSKWFFL